MSRKKLSLLLIVCLLSTLFVSAGSNVYAADTGLSAHYKFDGDMKDSSGNGNDGVLAMGNITYVDGPLGKAAVFDGKSYIEVNDSDSLDLGKEFTFSAWLYNDVIPIEEAQGIIVKTGNDYDEGYAYGMGEMSMVPYADRYDADAGRLGSTGKSSDKKIEAHKWQLLTITYDGTLFKFYLNGDLSSQKESYDTTTVITSKGKLQIGMVQWAGKNVFYRGRLDDLRIYNRLMSQDEVKGLYAEALAGPGKDLVIHPDRMIGYWNFDKDANDYSGYNNNGAAIGNITYVDSIASKGARFDGSSYIEIKDSDSIEADKGLTISCWAKTDAVKLENFVHPVIDKTQNSTNMDLEAYWLGIDTNNGQENFRPYFGAYGFNYNNDIIGNDISAMAYSDMKTGVWTMLTATFDGNAVKFYVNGKLLATKDLNFTDTIVHSNGKLYIGKWGNGVFARGVIDEVRLYNYALDGASVAKLMTLKDGLIVKLADGTVPTAMQLKQSIQLNAKLATYAFMPNVNIPGTGTDSFTESAITDVGFKSLTPKVATVDAKGKVTAVAKGKATIMVTCKEVVGYLTITVN